MFIVKNKMHGISIIFIIYYNYVKCIEYKWIVNDDRWDCVVGISKDGEIPISTGVIISTNYVATSANPLEEYIDSPESIKMHIIDGAHDKSQQIDVECMGTPFGHERKPLYWVNHGLDGKHSPLHDIMILRVTNEPGKHIYGTNSEPRMPFRAEFVSSQNSTYNAAKWMFGGFGYIDEDHIKYNDELEIETYNDAVLLSCDEIIPREWGRMICLENNDSLMGVSSGSPLFHKGMLFGIGNYELTKGNESIFVFTDVRPYAKHFHLCKDNNEFLKWWNDTTHLTVDHL